MLVKSYVSAELMFLIGNDKVSSYVFSLRVCSRGEWVTCYSEGYLVRGGQRHIYLFFRWC